VAVGPATVRNRAHAVKDAIVLREVEWRRSLGQQVVVSDVEREVAAKLERLVQKRKYAKPAAPKKRKRIVEPGEVAERSNAAAKMAEGEGYRYYQREAPKVIPAPSSPCKWCGACVRCRREARVRQIMAHALREDTPTLTAMAWELVTIGLSAGGGMGRFADLGAADRNRAITRAIEDVADRSVPLLGGWRP
jgi:hypothetical protein